AAGAGRPAAASRERRQSLAAPPGAVLTRATARMLDAKRLHLQDGPIDLVIEADAPADTVRAAYEAASSRFVSILDELCRELPLLRSAADPRRPPQGIVARRMWAAVLPHAAATFITPMAAVAGSVADEVLAVMAAAGRLKRAYVNN